MVNCKDKVVLITGASSGIGEAIAKRFAALNASLLLTGIGQMDLDRVAQECKAIGSPKVWSFEINLSDRYTIDGLFNFAAANEIEPAFFVLNAGISQRATTLDSPFEIDQRIMDINYFGHIYLIKTFKKLLASAKMTHIAVTTSISGLFGFPLRSAYCASKHALFGFFESLELENNNIKVTFLIPGRVNTQISKSAILANGERYNRMDPGQATGISVDKCAKGAVRAILNERHKKLLGGKELLMVFFYKFIPPLFYKLARNISAT